MFHRFAPVWAWADEFSRSWLMPEKVNRYRRWPDDQRLIAALDGEPPPPAGHLRLGT